ncbi:hypothetical protein PQX77_018093 [Marasmius sp. AFHP31]|nr:hypothetical protein PQX77_018093 [Marasmius sp. AFHP31]
MGVPGFLEACEEAQELWTLKGYAIKNGYQLHKRLRVGVDAKVVIEGCKAADATGDSTSTLQGFARVLGHYSAVPMAFVFVFDGPDQPNLKSNTQAPGIDSVLCNQARKLLEAFSYPSLTAPGDTHSCLAALAHAGTIDGVVSDDADLLLLGVPLLFRKAPRLNPLDLFYNVYSSENIRQKLKLTRGGMILTALLMGSDYDPRGVVGCGVKTAIEISSRTKLGDQLLADYRTFASVPEYLEASLAIWRDQLRLEVAHNVSGNLDKRRRCIAAAIAEDFPNVQIIEFYSGRLVTKLPQVRMQVRTALWQPQLPDLMKLVGIGRDVFGWPDEKLYRNFKENGVWKGIIIRMLASPFVSYDKNTKTFYENGLWLPLVTTRASSEVIHDLPSIWVTFSMDSLVSHMGINPKKGCRGDRECKGLNIGLWMPLAVLERAQGLVPALPLASNP